MSVATSPPTGMGQPGVPWGHAAEGASLFIG